MHVGEPEVTARETIGQPRVVEPQSWRIIASLRGLHTLYEPRDISSSHYTHGAVRIAHGVDPRRTAANPLTLS